MLDNYEACLGALLISEGGYQDDPKDKGNSRSGPGAATNLGVTQEAWAAYVGHPVNAVDISKLTPKVVAPFYKSCYWHPIQGDALPKGVDYVVFDTAVNMGPRRAAKLLQQTLHIPQDGAIGAYTIARTLSKVDSMVIKSFCQNRREFYKTLEDFHIFGKGWIHRVDRVEKEALSMVED